MNGQQTSRVKSLYLRLVNIDSPKDREAYLDQECEGDEQLRSEVLEFLSLEPQLGGFLEKQDLTPVATVDMPSIELKTQRIGPYKIREQLGEGGMGMVYVAEQSTPVRRQVALKIIKPGMDSREVVARFEAERQALAMMNHPHIAKVFDGGATPEGRPYFVMELVRGIPITEFCDEQRLSIRERLALFVSVCHAVQHAHQKGIIHRDLKPSNVLVELHDVKAVPKVIDFGVAKAISHQLSEQTVYTQFHQMVGTPLYMSPEQAQLTGLDVDTRSDVYSLGVLLYELLTGTTPFDRETLKSVGYDELRRMIREDEPPRPSQRVSTLNANALSTISDRRRSDARRFKLSISRELDWIVVKALEKDRTRRYASATALADDIERLLADEPVVASPPSITYRLGKFARRNRMLVTATTVVVAVVLLALAITTWKWNAERIARQNTEHQRQLAENNLDSALAAVDQLLTNVSEDRLLNEPYMEALRTRLLEDAVVFCNSLAQRQSNDAQVRRRVVEAQLRLGKIYRMTGEAEKARASFQRAVAKVEKWEPEGDPDVESVTLKIEAWTGLGSPVLGGVAENTDSAAQALSRALELGRLHQDQFNEDTNFLAIYARALIGLGRLQRDRGQAKRSHQNLDMAIAILRRAVASEPSNRELYQGLAFAIGQKGIISDPASRARLLSEQAERLDLYLEQNPNDKWARSTRADNWVTLGGTMRVLGKTDDATRYHKLAIEALTQLAEDFPETPFYVSEKASALLSLALATHSKEVTRAAQAKDYIEESLRLRRLLVERYPNADHYKFALAGTLNSFGVNLLSTGGHQNAALYLNEAKEVAEQLIKQNPDIPKYHLELANTLNGLSVTEDRSGNTAEAILLLEEGIRVIEHVKSEIADSSESRLQQCGMLFNLGLEQMEAKNLAEAEETFLRCSKQMGDLHAKFPQEIAYEDLLRKTCVELGSQVYFQQGEYEKAEDYLRRNLRICESFAERQPKSPDRLHALGMAHWDVAKVLDAARSDQSQTHYQKAGQILRRFVSPSKEGPLRRFIRVREPLVRALPEDLELRYKLADAYIRLANVQSGPYEERIPVNEKGLRLAKELIKEGPNRLEFKKTLASALVNHGLRLHKTVRTKEAKTALEKAKSYCERLVAENPDDEQCKRSYALSLGNLGDYFASEEEWSKTVELARKAIELQPNKANHWGSLGVALYRTGDFRAAAQTLEKARQMRAGKDLVHQFFLAMTYWQLGDMKKARELYGRAAAWFELRSNSGHIDLRSEAEELLGLDAPGRAALIEGYYTRSFPKNPTPQDLIDRGDWFRKQGSHDKAIESLTEAIELDPDNSGAYHRRALSHNFRADFRAAISDASQAIKLRPSYKGAYAERAWANIETGNYEQAIADCSEAIRLNPKSFWGYVRRSRAYHLSGRHREAVRDAKKAIDIDPASKLAYEWLADAHIALGQLEAARQAYHERLKIEPDHFSLWPGYCELLVLNHDLGEYRRFCRALLQRHAETKKPAVARAILKSVIVAPDAVEDWAIVIRLAELAGETGHVAMLARAGKFDQAIEFHNALIARRGGEPNAWNYLWLAMIEHGRGNQSKARELLSEGIKRIDGDSTLQDNLRLKLWRQEFAALIEPKPEEE